MIGKRFQEWREKKYHQRAERALERQIVYQQQKSARIKGNEENIIARMKDSSTSLRSYLSQFGSLNDNVRALEVGSGAHGHIFFFPAKIAVGVDPLAYQYSSLFPSWQRRVPTIAAQGEQLPFADHSFNVVLCDNVIDHAEFPQKIVGELARVLEPGGLLYFTVNVHHPVYALASQVHGAWNAVGLSFEIGPFADHTVHLRLSNARKLIRDLPLRILSEEDNIAATKTAKVKRRHAGDLLKQVFYKNAVYRVVAERKRS